MPVPALNRSVVDNQKLSARRCLNERPQATADNHRRRCIDLAKTDNLLHGVDIAAENVTRSFDLFVGMSTAWEVLRLDPSTAEPAGRLSTTIKYGATGPSMLTGPPAKCIQLREAGESVRLA